MDQFLEFFRAQSVLVHLVELLIERQRVFQLGEVDLILLLGESLQVGQDRFVEEIYAFIDVSVVYFRNQELICLRKY